jgi:hypothetical protein
MRRFSREYPQMQIWTGRFACSAAIPVRYTITTVFAVSCRRIYAHHSTTAKPLAKVTQNPSPNLLPLIRKQEDRSLALFLLAPEG